MPRPDNVQLRLVAEWIRKAQDDARVLDLLAKQPSGFANPVCFHAQQVVEKLLKAYLTLHQVSFPKTHDVERLLVLVAAVDRNLADYLEDTSVLTLYGVEIRYPGDRPEASEQEAVEALALAAKTRTAILPLLPSQE